MAIYYNAIRTPDGTVLESRYRHDYKEYVDANGKEYMVDGGRDYLRRSANGDEVELSIMGDKPSHETLRAVMVWGTRGKDGKQPLKFIRVAGVSIDDVVFVRNLNDRIDKANHALDKNRDKHLQHYLALIRNSRTYEDVIEIWKEAEEISEKILGAGTALVTLSEDSVNFIKQDVEKRMSA